MKNITKNNVLILTILILLISFIVIPKNIYATTNNEMLTNITIAYFSSEVTKGYGNGDCILLENYDSNGNKIYGLIDTGRKITTTDNEEKESTVVKNFLQSHGVEELEFIIITHSHADHNGDTLTVLNEFDVKTIYMKEYDNTYSPSGTQSIYENILKLCVEKNINIVGISYLSTMSNEISPSATSSFISYMEQNENKETLFSPFDENNTSFKFGSSNIQLLNWEIFDTDGNIYKTGISTSTKEIVSDENANSLCILLTQGNKKAVFSGDMNNYLYGNETVGDEDRIKSEIGEIDFLKLGHHGYQGSNTEGYVQTLNPKYAVITNDIGKAYNNIKSWLETNNVKYMYTTEDEKEIIVAITENDVYMGLNASELYEAILKEEITTEEKENEVIEKDENENKNNENEEEQIENTQVEYDSTTKANSTLPYARKNKNIIYYRSNVMYYTSFLHKNKKL